MFGAVAMQLRSDESHSAVMDVIEFEGTDITDRKWLEPIAPYYCPFDSEKMIRTKDDYYWECPVCFFTISGILNEEE